METRKDHSETTRIDQPANAQLLQLPAELLTEIDQHLENPIDKSNAEQICSHLYRLFAYDMKRKATILARLTLQEKTSAIHALLDKNPCLIKEISHVIRDEAGRKLQGTAYQLALGRQDITMINLLTPYFQKIPNGEEEKLEQFNEYYNAETKASYDFQPIVQAISEEQFIDGEMCIKTKEILNTFRETFVPDHIIKPGKYFDPHALYRAMEEYDNHANSWNDKQRDLFLKNVIIFLVRQLPTDMNSQFEEMYIKTIEEDLIKGDMLNNLTENDLTELTEMDTSNISRLLSQEDSYILYNKIINLKLSFKFLAYLNRKQMDLDKIHEELLLSTADSQLGFEKTG